MAQLSCDVSSDVLGGVGQSLDGQDGQEASIHQHQPLTCGVSGSRMGVLEDDVPSALDVCADVERNPPAPTPQEVCEQDRIAKLFPNSFKIAGIKHICDNALSSILQIIPRSLAEYSSDVFDVFVVFQCQCQARST